jgi:hypothetical protein
VMAGVTRRWMAPIPPTGRWDEPASDALPRLGGLVTAGRDIASASQPTPTRCSAHAQRLGQGCPGLHRKGERVRTVQVAAAAQGGCVGGDVARREHSAPTPAGLPPRGQPATGLGTAIVASMADGSAVLLPTMASGVLLAGSQTQMLFHWP